MQYVTNRVLAKKKKRSSSVSDTTHNSESTLVNPYLRIGLLTHTLIFQTWLAEYSLSRGKPWALRLYETNRNRLTQSQGRHGAPHDGQGLAMLKFFGEKCLFRIGYVLADFWGLVGPEGLVEVRGHVVFGGLVRFWGLVGFGVLVKFGVLVEFGH